MSASLFDAAKTISALEVAERYAGVEVKRKGMKYWCRCPMPGHQEKTPSCTFDPNTGKFYCFGCHAGGSSVDFVAQLLGITPKEAAVRICTDYGLAYDEDLFYVDYRPYGSNIRPFYIVLEREADRDRSLFSIPWEGLRKTGIYEEGDAEPDNEADLREVRL